MKSKKIALSLILILFACLTMTLFTGCAVTYPIKDGSVTLSFTPPPELLNKYGINYELPKPKGTK